MTTDTLHDIYHKLPEHYAESSCATLRSALKRAERLTGKRLWQLPANEKAWSEAVARIDAWAGEFPGAPEVAERRFRTWAARVGSVIRKVSGTREAVPSEAAAAWAQLAHYVGEVENTFDETGRRILPNMASVSLAMLRSRLGATAPQALDHAAAVAALRRLPSDKTASFRDAVAFFDSLIRARDRHAPIAALLPEAPLGPLPGRRDAALDWTRFSPEFLASRDAALARAVTGAGRGAADRAERIAARRAGRRLGRRAGRNAAVSRRSYMSALSWLLRHAAEDRADLYGVTTLEEVLTEDHVEAAAQRFVARTESDPELKPASETASLKTYLAALAALAKVVEVDEYTRLALEDIATDPAYVSPDAGRMSTTREDFVRLVDRDPAIVRAIVAGPETLMRDAVRGFDRWERLGDNQRAETLHLAMAAAAMAVQLARPLRTRNVAELDLEGDLMAPHRAGVKPWLAIERRKVKNRRPIEGPVPGRLWRVVETWRDRGRPLWIARHAATGAADTGALFPGTRGGALSRTTFNKAWNRGMSRLGLPGLTPHTMRHVAATLYLAVHPGGYDVVAALLCDTVRSVENFYVRGEGRAAAELFASVVEELAPGLDLRGAR
ncbi:tyrosine-type recombinase/integrase [Rhodosalinus sediminis]|uniref:tyrosine-type recombinase/integrase n=1 Tax=Rhodosalinus sediminis TaxID=1940533 RepID=UPI0023553A23|nr:tyrosine-type recombinase/integrase [Rhodosalinus sediminis]